MPQRRLEIPNIQNLAPGLPCWLARLVQCTTGMA